MKLRPIAKLDNRNKQLSKIFDDYVISRNCDFIIISLIYGQFGAIQKPESGRILCKT